MDFEKDNVQESENQLSVQDRNWQDGRGGGDGSNNSPNEGPPPNEIPTTNENIPQMSEDERSSQNKWRNSRKMQQGLQNLLPKKKQRNAPTNSRDVSPEQIREESNQQSDNPLQSPIIGFYGSVQNLKPGDLNGKIEKGFGNFMTVASTTKSATAFASGVNKANETASKSKAVTGSVASGLTALKDGVMSIKHIYDAYKDATSQEGTSSQDKIETGLKIVRELLSSAHGAISSLKAILDLFQKASGGLATAIPGLGIALNAVTISINVYELIKAKTNEAFIQKELQQNAWEGTLSTKKSWFGKKKKSTGKEKRNNQDRYIATFEEEISKMSKKEQRLLKEKSRYEGKASKAKKLEEVNQKLQNTQSALALAKKQLASIKDNQALTNLAQINQDRQKNAGFNIGVELTSLVGNVLSLVPEASAQVASVSLKAAAAGAVLFKKVGGFIVQKARDHADKKPDSFLNGMVDTSRSTNKEMNRKKETVRYIFRKISDCDLEDGRSINAISQFIEAAGMSPNRLARINRTKGLDEAISALIKAQGGSGGSQESEPSNTD